MEACANFKMTFLLCIKVQKIIACSKHFHFERKSMITNDTSV